LVLELEQPSFNATETMHKIQELRGSARTNMNAPSATADTKRLGQSQQAAADALEKLVEEQATRLGHGSVVENMQAARTRMAKSYDIQESIDPRTGNLDPGRLAALSASGAPKTGGVRNLSEVAQALPGAMKNPDPSEVLTQRISAHSAVNHPQNIFAHLLSRITDPVARSRVYQELFVNPRNKLLPDRERLLRVLIGAESKDNEEQQ
jgi:hypothetical protein